MRVVTQSFSTKNGIGTIRERNHTYHIYSSNGERQKKKKKKTNKKKKSIKKKKKKKK